MVNSQEFSKRLEKILEYYALSASSFAQKIGVGRSSISHILSGRNKPSLEFVMKLLNQFPEIDLYWLMNGKGDFKADSAERAEAQKSIPSSPRPNSFSNTAEKKEKDHPANLAALSSKQKSIEKIIILYKDGSFESFQN